MEFLLVFHKIFPYFREGLKNTEGERNFGKIMFSQFLGKTGSKIPGLERVGECRFLEAGDFLIPRC